MRRQLNPETDKRFKLTPEEVEVLRLLRKNGHPTLQIAQWFGISQAQVSRIANRQSWRKAAGR